MYAVDPLTAGVTMFLATVSGCVGVGASQMELNTKFVNSENYPLLRTTGAVFFKTVQSAAAVLSLSLLGSLTISSPPVAGALLFAGIIGICTPGTNALIQHSNKNESLKDIAEQIDNGVNIFAKTTNIAAATLLAFATYGTAGAALTCLGAGVIGIAAYSKTPGSATASPGAINVTPYRGNGSDISTRTFLQERHP